MRKETDTCFDPINSPLEGTTLIEAAAGTGKTYTITFIFLRLIIERNLPVSGILVVTFTEAATAELKGRILEKLREAESIAKTLIQDPHVDNPKNPLYGLFRKVKSIPGALSDIRSAIRNFDEAAIFTIHGFCRRMLSENAFESGNLFNTQLVTDASDLIREVVEDFWRKRFYEIPEFFSKYVLEKKLDPEKLIDFVNSAGMGRDIRVLPSNPDIPDLDVLIGKRNAVLETTMNIWKESRNEIETLLLEHEGLNRRTYGKKKIPQWCRILDEFFDANEETVFLPEKWVYFTTSKLKNTLKDKEKPKGPPRHPFFDNCEELQKITNDLISGCDLYLIAIQSELITFVKEELEKRKKERNTWFFDDLLLQLRSALKSDGGTDLVRSIRNKFRAALIDEFQDTDPVQYEIFRRIFHFESGILFLIGDPKQAIYGFRGADIFTYIKAAGDVKRKFTLEKNYRSHIDMVNAVNTLFHFSQDPFVFREIPFFRVDAEMDGEPRFRVDGEDVRKTLFFWPIFRSTVSRDKKKGPNKSEAEQIVTQMTAAEISRLLSLAREGKAVLEGRPLQEGDIAVLVYRNREARIIAAKLSELSISSVIFDAGNIFETKEARELEIIMTAVCDPRDETRMRTALVTDIMGVDGNTLETLFLDENTRDDVILKFSGYRSEWESGGFIRMFTRFMELEGVTQRLAGLPEGERRITNLFHLSELIHKKALEKKLDMRRLLQWFSEKIQSPDRGSDESLLRLSTDADAVKIVTIHKSKGLEYPIVFCPFLWNDFPVKTDRPFVFHDPEKKEAVLDIGSKDRETHFVQAFREGLAENLRLLYVALTRAKYRCYAAWGRIGSKNEHLPAPAWLIHRKQMDETSADPLADQVKQFWESSEKELNGDLEKLEKSGHNIAIQLPPESLVRSQEEKDADNISLFVREFTRDIGMPFRITSFSALLTGGKPDIPEHEPVPIPGGLEINDPEEKMNVEPVGIFGFPRGPVAGTVLHEILEEIDFTETEAGRIDPVIQSKLEEYGIESGWAGTVREMVQELLNAPLSKNRTDFTLSRISKGDRITEMEFNFPLKYLTPERLHGVFEKKPGAGTFGTFPERIGMLGFSPVKGFMKGFVDLIFRFEERFYLVDWKSNHLGNRTEDYNQENLARAMEAHCYVLQYMIYVAALDRYLRVRMPGYTYEKHFGGIFYIFLRGIDKNRTPDFGIFSDRPEKQVVEAFAEALIPHSG